MDIRQARDSLPDSTTYFSNENKSAAVLLLKMIKLQWDFASVGEPTAMRSA